MNGNELDGERRGDDAGRDRGGPSRVEGCENEWEWRLLLREHGPGRGHGHGAGVFAWGSSIHPRMGVGRWDGMEGRAYGVSTLNKEERTGNSSVVSSNSPQCLKDARNFCYQAYPFAFIRPASRAYGLEQSLDPTVWIGYVMAMPGYQSNNRRWQEGDEEKVLDEIGCWLPLARSPPHGCP
jgi:hypothetical protein